MPQNPPQPDPRDDAYKAYLKRMGSRIVMHGGTLADVQRWLDHAERTGLKNNAFQLDDPDLNAKPSTPGMLKGLSQQTLQGATFGFADEAFGSLFGLFHGVTPEEGIELWRSDLEAFSKEHRVASGAAQLAGGILPMMLAPGAAAESPAITGGVAGALFGAGDAVGGLSDRAKAALYGGGVGMVLGRPFAALGKKAAGLIGKTVSSVVPKWDAVVSRLPGTPQYAARQVIREALAKDGLVVEDLARAAEQRIQQGTPTTLADVGGSHTMDLAQTSMQFQSPQAQQLAKQFAERQTYEGARLLSALGTDLRVGLKNADEMLVQMSGRQAAKAAPLYQQAHKQSIPVSKELEALLVSQEGQTAYQKAFATAALEDASPLPSRGLSLPAMTVADDGSVVVPKDMPIRGLDYFKQELDVLINKLGENGKPVMSQRQSKALRASLNSVIDDASTKVPVYGEARNVWGGIESMKNAINMGREFMTKSPVAIKQEMMELTANALKPGHSAGPAMYRIGMMQAASDAVHGSNASVANASKQLFGAQLFGAGDRTALQRIQAAFDNPLAAQAFADKVAGEAGASATSNALGKTLSPNPNAATRALLPRGKIGTFLETRGFAVRETGRAQEIADEILSAYAKGLSNPHELPIFLRLMGSEPTIPMGRLGDVRIPSARVLGANVGGQVASTTVNHR